MVSVRGMIVAGALVAFAFGVSWDQLTNNLHDLEGDDWLNPVAWGAAVIFGGVPVVGVVLRWAGCGGNDSTTARWMGSMERAALYVLFMLTAPKAIAALVAFKTAIRWPRLEHSDDARRREDKFAEAFFIAMLVNVGFAATGAWLAGADLTTLP